MRTFTDELQPSCGPHSTVRSTSTRSFGRTKPPAVFSAETLIATARFPSASAAESRLDSAGARLPANRGVPATR